MFFTLSSFLFQNIFQGTKTVRPWDVDKFVNLLWQRIRVHPKLRERMGKSIFSLSDKRRRPLTAEANSKVFYPCLSKRMTNVEDPRCFCFFCPLFSQNTCWKDSFQPFLLGLPHYVCLHTRIFFLKTFFFSFLLNFLFCFLFFFFFVGIYILCILHMTHRNIRERSFWQRTLYEFEEGKKKIFIIAYWNN